MTLKIKFEHQFASFLLLLLLVLQCYCEYTTSNRDIIIIRNRDYYQD